MDVAAKPLMKGELTVPNWLIRKSIVFFFAAMLACWGTFGFVPEFELWLVSCLSVVLFFYCGMSMSKSWSNTKEKAFIKNVFAAGLVIRLIWMFYCYFYFNPEHYGHSLGDGSDVEWYMPFGKNLAEWLSGESKFSLAQIIELNKAAIDDVGYPMWLGLIYVITGPENDLIVPLLLKCLFGAYCAVSIYRVAKRHFGEGDARMAAIFVCVNPNMIYWCGTMMKEAEMVFLVCLAVDYFDRVFTSGKKFTFRNLLPGMLAATALMFFRAALGIVIFLAVFAHIVMASQRVMGVGKKVLAGLLVAVVLALSMGERIRTQSRELIQSAQSDTQQTSMEWRTQRKGGNALAKYAGSSATSIVFKKHFPIFSGSTRGNISCIWKSGLAATRRSLSNTPSGR